MATAVKLLIYKVKYYNVFYIVEIVYGNLTTSQITNTRKPEIFFVAL